MNGEALLNQVRKFSGLSISTFDEINDAYETILRRGGMWQTRVRDEHSLQFSENKTRYLLPMDRIRRLEGVAVRNNTDELEWSPLTLADDEKFDAVVFANRDSDGNDETDVPTHYRLAGDEIEVTPTPDGNYQARLVYIGNPPAIDRLTTPVIPANYHRLLAKLAAAYALRLTDKPENQARGQKLESECRNEMLAFAYDVSAPSTTDMPRPFRIMRS